MTKLLGLDCIDWSRNDLANELPIHNRHRLQRLAIRICALASLAFVGNRSSLAQNGPQAWFQADVPQPASLIVDAVQNEIKLIHYDQSYLRYRVHTRDQKGDQIRDVVESKDGTVARLIRRDDRTLTPDEDAAEHGRLKAMLESPSAFEKHIEKDRSGKQMAVDMIKLLPDAMIFTFTQGQPQRGDHPSGEPTEYVIDFQPNPQWSPPTMTSDALTGLKGRCWLDRKTHYLTRLETQIFQGVNFGFGIFAHIYPGGQFVVEQHPVGDQRWIVGHFVQHVTLRVIVKTIKQDSDLFASSFVQVPPMSYEDAILMLLSTPLPTAASETGSR